MSGVRLVEGDISVQEVDAVINAANASLQMGSGVAGAIRERGGPSIQHECDALGPIEVGRAAVTFAGDLKARFVIHAAVMEIGGVAEAESVRSSLEHALVCAAERACATVACPALGTGVGGLGLQRCAEMSLEVARRVVAADGPIDEVRFVLFGEPAYRVFEMVDDAEKVLRQMQALERR